MFDHIILVSLDTLRSDCIGANPHKLWPRKYPRLVPPATPCLDALAGESAFFPNCVTTAPYTSAAHASYFTGKWPLHHGLFEFFNRKMAGWTLFTEARRRGYRTIFKTDFPIILGPFLGFDRDVDQYLIEDDEAFLESLAQTPKSFAFAHFGGLHSPYGFHNLRYGGQAYVDKVAELEAELPPAPAQTLHDQLIETYREPRDLELLLRYKRAVLEHYARGHYEQLFALYLAGVEYFLEHRFRRFLERLLELLRGTRYLLVVFGDHGEEYDADSCGHFDTVAEGVLRVPLLFHGPGVRPAFHPQRIRSVDMAPTLLELWNDGAARGTRGLRLDGTSLANTVCGGSDYPLRDAFAQCYLSNTGEFVTFQQRALTRGKKSGTLRHVLYKEAVYAGNFRLTRQRYNHIRQTGLTKPCAERLELAEIDHELKLHPSRRPEIAAALTAKLDDYNRSRGRSQPALDVPRELREQLQNMGYRI